MTASETVTRRKMGLATLFGSIFLLAVIVWGTITFIQVQGGLVRTEPPHEPYNDIPPWPYDIPWAGGRSNWFENVNYTDLPLDMQLPEDLLDQLENVIFYVTPENPPQLWRSGAYDVYDGSGWSKSTATTTPLTSGIISYDEAMAIGNEIYTVIINVTAGPNVGAIELPTLFPNILVIADSFTTGSFVNSTYQPDSDSRLISYELETDEYGTLLFRPLIDAPTGESVLISYEITFETQDLNHVASAALPGDQAPPEIRTRYGLPSLEGVELTQRVIDNITQFENVGDNAFEKATIVATYFQNTFELMINESQYLERPEPGREITDWFLERGGGLPMDFATAYCVFMRYLDVPARIVLGYAVGDPEGGYRTIRVRHMMFWVEVFIPTSDPSGGEWIQIVPLPLPSDMGGSEVPQNTLEGDVQLLVWPDVSQPWVLIGEEFRLSALLLVNGVPVTSGEQIIFRDVTDNHLIGAADIRPGRYLPLANITYTYQPGATPGLHNISATFQGPTYTVTNYTSLYVVAQPSPFETTELQSSNFVLSDTVDVDLQLGLDNYTSHWNDILYVHGVMTVGGQPVDGTTLKNNQIQIMWDDYFVGNATIQSDGSYSLDILVDPSDFRMHVGLHEVWSQYAGEYTDEGIPILLPARSADNSTVEVRGTIDLTLTARPTVVYLGSTLHYEGQAQLSNGTILSNENVGLFFGGVQITTVTTNSTGGFSYDYAIPLSQTPGFYDAQANWTSTIFRIDGNWSNSVSIEVKLRGAQITIDSTPKSPQVVHPYENITIFGYLTDLENGSGLVGESVDIYWDTGSGPVKIGTVITASGGYYEFNYTVPDTYLGSVSYWTEYISPYPTYLGATSPTMTIIVQPWITNVTIQVDSNPAHPTETITFTGQVLLPELGGVALGGAPVTIWWGNSTGPHNLTVTYTDINTGVYQFSFQVPFYHEFGTFNVWAEFVSPSIAFLDDVSDNLTMTITNYTTSLTIFSNSSYYHLNETAHIYGQLQFENGTPITNATVHLTWTNSSGSFDFLVVTNATGWYNFYYNFSIDSDSTGTVSVSAYFTSWTRIHSDANATISSVTVQLYQINLNANTDKIEYHQDEIITFSGTLTFNENGAPISGATIYVYYKNAASTYTYTKVTDTSGNFVFLYNLTTNDTLGAIYLWAQYIRTDPLWDNATSLNRTATIILYRLLLTTSTNSTFYHLNETIMVTGQLTFEHNGTPIPYELVDIHMAWPNGTITVFPGYQTNSTGHFEFYYNCSVPKDSPGTITIWAEYTSTNPLWDNATSAPGVDVDLILYPLQLMLTGPSTAYLDESVVLQGNLAYSGGSPVLPGESINLFISDGGPWVFVDTIVTDPNGNYQYLYNFTIGIQSAGTYYFMTNYSSTDPLNSDAQSSQIAVVALKRPVNLDIVVIPTTVKLNESITIYIHLYLQNGIPVSNAPISVWWDNGTAYLIYAGQTNGTGELEFLYTGFENHTIWTGISVYATYSGNELLLNNESIHISITLEQWATLITGFSTFGQTQFYISEYVPVNGTLYYDDKGSLIAFSSAVVSLLFDGSPVTTATTMTNGTFFTLWRIPDDTSPGWHQLAVAYYPSVTWIAGSSSSPIAINVSAYQLVWTIEVNPNPVFLSDLLNISGTLALDNGSVYTNAVVNIYWDHTTDSTGAILLAQLLTDSTGYFEYLFYVDVSTVTGITIVWAECIPSEPYILARSSGTVVLQIQQIPVNVTVTAYPLLAYRGDSISISGNLYWGNGTGSPMVSYDVSLVLEGSLVMTVTTGTTGSFEFTYSLPWNQSLGNIPFFVEFVRPTAAFEAAASESQTIEIRDTIVIVINPKPSDPVILGNTLIVNGTVTNANGPVAGVPLIILLDGIETTATGSTDSNGQYSLSLLIDIGIPAGPHTISVNVTNQYYDLGSPIDNWDITIYVASDLEVYLQSEISVTIDESFSVDIRLRDSNGNPLTGSLSVNLGGITLDSVTISQGTWNTFTFTIPQSWSQSGKYNVTVVYNGDSPNYILGDTANTILPVHVFVDFEITTDVPTAQLAGSPLVVRGTLLDDKSIPIGGRTITIVVNGTNYTAVTNANGTFEVTAVPSTVAGVYLVSISLQARNTTIPASNITVHVQINTGGNMQFGDLLIPLAALGAAIISVLLYLYFVKGYFRGAPRTTGIDIPTKLRNIKKLADAGKYGSAITLAYRTFEQMCGMKTGAERLSSETSREYLDRVLKTLPLDSNAVEQFVQFYEEARFSQHEMTRGQYETAMRIFTDLYPRIDVRVPTEK